MKGLIARIMSVTFVLGLGADIAQAQSWPGSVPLGDIARQLNAQRAKAVKKTRLFTNDDLVALRTSSDQSAPSAATSLPTTSKEAKAGENPAKLTSANQTWAKAKFRAASGTGSDAGTLVKHPAPSPKRALTGQASQGAASGQTEEWAKAKFRAGQGNTPATVEPGPIPATSLTSPPSPREDIGYVERANGQVEAIVAEGQHVGLVRETEAFAKNFHDPAPSLAEVEFAQTSPLPTSPPPSSSPEADQTYPSSSAQDGSSSPSAGGGVDVAASQQPEPTPGDNGASQSEASATLESEALADYAGDQFRVKPPETLQPPPCPVMPPPPPESGTNRSTAKPLGYVEKAGGEKEAIVEFRDQVYLVHEGELFAEKFRVLRVTASSVEIVEELTEASSGFPARRRNSGTDLSPDSR